MGNWLSGHKTRSDTEPKTECAAVAYMKICNRRRSNKNRKIQSWWPGETVEWGLICIFWESFSSKTISNVIPILVFELVLINIIMEHFCYVHEWWPPLFEIDAFAFFSLFIYFMKYAFRMGFISEQRIFSFKLYWIIYSYFVVFVEIPVNMSVVQAVVCMNSRCVFFSLQLAKKPTTTEITGMTLLLGLAIGTATVKNRKKRVYFFLKCSNWMWLKFY